MKTFRQAPGHPEYKISEDGIVMKGDKTLKQSFHKTRGKEYPNGYYYVTLLTPLCRGPISVHRLVAFTYLESPKEGQIWVNHKDGNKLNNHVNNLEWTTIRENIQHAFDNKLRKMPKGADHWLYGRKVSVSTKNKLSVSKIGRNHPKFKGLYIVHHLKYESAPLAAKAWKENARTILRKCKAGKQGSEYYFVPISHEA